MVIMKLCQCCIVMVQHINPRNNLSRVTALPVLCCMSRQKHLYSGVHPKAITQAMTYKLTMKLVRSCTLTSAVPFSKYSRKNNLTMLDI